MKDIKFFKNASIIKIIGNSNQVILLLCFFLITLVQYFDKAFYQTDMFYPTLILSIGLFVFLLISIRQERKYSYVMISNNLLEYHQTFYKEHKNTTQIYQIDKIENIKIQNKCMYFEYENEIKVIKILFNYENLINAIKQQLN